jgi:chromosome segregation ATPase
MSEFNLKEALTWVFDMGLEVQRDVSRKDATIERQSEMIQQLDNQKEHLRKDCEKLDRELTALKKFSDKMKEQNVDLTQQNEAVQTNVNTMGRQIMELTEELAPMRTRIKELEDALDSAEKDRMKQKNLADNLGTRMEELEVDHENVHNHLLRERLTSEGLQAQLTAAQNTSSELQRAYDETHQDLVKERLTSEGLKRTIARLTGVVT